MSFFSKFFKKQQPIEVNKTNLLNNLSAYEYAVITLGGVLFSPFRITLSQSFVILNNLATHPIAEGSELKKRVEEFVKIFQEDLLSSFEYSEITQNRIAKLNERYAAQGFQLDGSFTPTEESIPEIKNCGTFLPELIKNCNADGCITELLLKTILDTPHDIFFFPSVLEDEKKELALSKEAIQAVRDFIEKLNSDILEILSQGSLPMRHLFEEEELKCYYTALSKVHSNPAECSGTLKNLQSVFSEYAPFSLYAGMAERYCGNFESAKCYYRDFEQKCHAHEENDAYSALNAMERILVLEKEDSEEVIALLDIIRENFVLYNSNTVFFAVLVYLLLGKKAESADLLVKNNYASSQLFPAIQKLCSDQNENEEIQEEKHSALYECWKDCTVSRLKAKAESGDADAQYQLGDHYFDIGSFTDSLYWYDQAAKQNHLNARASFISTTYAFNLPKEISAKQEKEVFNALAELYEKDNHEAGIELALFYLYGVSCEKNEQQYEEILQQLISRGYDLALCFYVHYLILKCKPLPDTLISSLEDFATTGNIRAQQTLANFYLKNIDDEQTREKAMFWLKQAAEQGDLLSAAFYGMILSASDDPVKRGEGIQIVMDAAISACPTAQFFLGQIILESGTPGGVFPISQAAEQKCPQAIARMALFNLTGEYFDQDIEKAKEWINIGLPLEAVYFYHIGNPSCIELAGMMLLRGVQPGMETWHSHIEAAAAQGNSDAVKFLAIEKMPPEDKISEYSSLLTVEQIRTLAEKGNAEAQFQLSVRYMNGEGVEKNIVEARKWLEQAGSQGHEEAISLLFQDCLNAEEREFDLGQAYYWAKKGADLGYPESELHLSMCLIQGMGIKPNKKAGGKMLLQAVEHGNINAMHMAAGHYLKGDLFKEDEKKAIELIIKSAEGGHSAAAYTLGMCLHDGLGVDKNEEESIKWIQRSAVAGNTEALMRLGLYYFNGENLEKNSTAAVQCFYKAAVGGNINAQYYLADCLYHGEGVYKDIDAAIHWFTIAAEQGFTDAQLKLSKIYGSGYNGPRDKEKAAYWMQKALAAGKK